MNFPLPFPSAAVREVFQNSELRAMLYSECGNRVERGKVRVLAHFSWNVLIVSLACACHCGISLKDCVLSRPKFYTLRA